MPNKSFFKTKHTKSINTFYLTSSTGSAYETGPPMCTNRCLLKHSASLCCSTKPENSSMRSLWVAMARPCHEGAAEVWEWEKVIVDAFANKDRKSICYLSCQRRHGGGSALSDPTLGVNRGCCNRRGTAVVL